MTHLPRRPSLLAPHVVGSAALWAMGLVAVVGAAWLIEDRGDLARRGMTAQGIVVEGRTEGDPHRRNLRCFAVVTFRTANGETHGLRTSCRELREGQSVVVFYDPQRPTRGLYAESEHGLLLGLWGEPIGASVAVVGLFAAGIVLFLTGRARERVSR